jgi:hypothetical protein
MAKIKVSPKDETLARALIAHRLWRIRFPKEKIEERVQEAWPAYLWYAQSINHLLPQIKAESLDGETTQAQVDRWQNEAEDC